MTYKTKNINTINPTAAASFNKITVNRFVRAEGADGTGASNQNLQGSAYGFVGGGYGYPPSPYIKNDMDRFPFAISSGSASTIGTMTVYALGRSSSMSPTEGFAAGGFPPYSSYSHINVIDKFPLSASPVTSTDVGDLQIRLGRSGGHSSETHGYNTGGAQPFPSGTNYIQKYPFSAPGNAADVADLYTSTFAHSSSSSTTHGYCAGGDYSPYPSRRIISKFPFAADDNGTFVGNLVQYFYYTCGGEQSTTHGYASGHDFYSNSINKFSFASDGGGTDVGNLAVSSSLTAGCSSTTDGYVCGSWPSSRNNIQKYPFASDTNATDIADLSRNRGDAHGHHV